MPTDLPTEADFEAIDARPTTATPVSLSDATVRASNLAERGLSAYTTPRATDLIPDVPAAPPLQRMTGAAFAARSAQPVPPQSESESSAQLPAYPSAWQQLRNIASPNPKPAAVATTPQPQPMPQVPASANTVDGLPSSQSSQRRLFVPSQSPVDDSTQPSRVQSAAPQQIVAPKQPDQPQPTATQPNPAPLQSIPGGDATSGDPIAVAQAKYEAAREAAGQSIVDTQAKLSKMGFSVPLEHMSDTAQLHSTVQSRINSALASDAANASDAFGGGRRSAAAEQLRSQLENLRQRASAAIETHSLTIRDLASASQYLHQAQNAQLIQARVAAQRPAPVASIPGLLDDSSTDTDPLQTATSKYSDTRAKALDSLATVQQHLSSMGLDASDESLSHPSRLTSGVHRWANEQLNSPEANAVDRDGYLTDQSAALQDQIRQQAADTLSALQSHGYNLQDLKSAGTNLHHFQTQARQQEIAEQNAQLRNATGQAQLDQLSRRGDIHRLPGEVLASSGAPQGETAQTASPNLLDHSILNPSAEQQWTAQSIDEAKAGKRSYSITPDGKFNLSDTAPMASLTEAVQDGVVPSPPPEVWKATADKQKLIDSAGKHPEIKAALAGAGRGAAFMAGAPIGAGIVGAATSETGPGAGLGALLGGLATGSAAAWGYGRALEALAKHNETINSFVASQQLHPWISAGADIATNVAGLPRAAMKGVGEGLSRIADSLAGRSAVAGDTADAIRATLNASKVADAAGLKNVTPAVEQDAYSRAASALDSIGKTYASSGGGLAASIERFNNLAKVSADRGDTSGTIAAAIAKRAALGAAGNIVIDSVLKDTMQGLGLSDEGQTQSGALTAGLLGLVASGHGISRAGYSNEQLGNMLLQAQAHTEMGVDLNSKIDLSKLREKFPNATDEMTHPLTPEGQEVWEAYQHKAAQLISEGKIPADPSHWQAQANQILFSGRKGGITAVDIQPKFPKRTSGSVVGEPTPASPASGGQDEGSQGPLSPPSPPQGSGNIPVEPQNGQTPAEIPRPKSSGAAPAPPAPSVPLPTSAASVPPATSGGSGSSLPSTPNQTVEQDEKHRGDGDGISPLGENSSPTHQGTQQAPPSPETPEVPAIQKALMAGTLSHPEASAQLAKLGLYPDDITRAIGPAPAGSSTSSPAVEPLPETLGGNVPDAAETLRAQLAQARQTASHAEAREELEKSEGNTVGAAYASAEASRARNDVAALQARVDELDRQQAAVPPAASSEPAAAAHSQHSALQAAKGPLPIPGMPHILLTAEQSRRRRNLLLIATKRALRPEEQAELAQLDPPQEQPISQTSESHRANEVLQRAVQRMLDEEDGKAVLRDMIDDGISPRDVVKQFWDSTYDKLNDQQQHRFQRMIANVTGLRVGDVIATRDTPEGGHEEFVAHKWSDVYGPDDTSTEARHLEGTERGLVVLMRLANEGAGQMKEANVVPPNGALGDSQQSLPNPARSGDALTVQASSSSSEQTLHEPQPSAPSIPDIPGVVNPSDDRGWGQLSKENKGQQVELRDGRQGIAYDIGAKRIAFRPNGGGKNVPVLLNDARLIQTPFTNINPPQDLVTGASRHSEAVAEEVRSTQPEQPANAAPASHDHPTPNPSTPAEEVAASSASPGQPTEPDEAGSANHKLAGERSAEAGGNQQAGVTKPFEPAEAEKSLKALARWRRNEFDHLRTDLVPGEVGNGGAIALSPADGTVIFDAKTLAEWMSIVRENGRDPMAWLHQTITHELIHRAQTLLAGDFRAKYTKIWDSLKPDARSAALKVLASNPGLLDDQGVVIPCNAAAEFERSVIEYRRSGTTSEELGGVNIDALKPFLEKPHSQLLENSIAQVNSLRAEPPIPGVEPPATESTQEAKPVESQEPKEVAPQRGKKSFKVRAPYDEHFASNPIVQVIEEHGGLLSKSTAKSRWSADKWNDNKGEWDDAPALSHPSHNRIYKPNGLKPNEMAMALIEAHLLPEGSTEAEMWKAIGQASESANRMRGQESAAKRNAATAEKQQRAFSKDALNPKDGTEAIPADSLQVGDVVDVNGEKMKVIAIDPESFAVTLEDHTKYGIQHVEDGQMIYGQVESKAPAEVGNEPEPAKQPAGTTPRSVESAASRFKPRERIEFPKPFTGPSGAALTGYEWQWHPEEYADKRGEDRVRRVSDWEKAESSAETGRDLVHQFSVKMPNGEERLVSAESVPKLLGYVGESTPSNLPSLVSATKTLAKQQMKLAIAEAQIAENARIEEEVAKLPVPKISGPVQAYPGTTSNTKAYVIEGTKAWQVQNEENGGNITAYTRDSLVRQWREAEEAKRGAARVHTDVRGLKRLIEKQERKIKLLTEANAAKQPAEPAKSFSLEKPESVDEQRARMEAAQKKRDEEKAKAEMIDKAKAPLKGDAGDLTADIFGDGETPLFNENRSNPEKASAQPEPTRASDEFTQEFGEKIGGARRDMAEKTGPRAPKPKDERPAWMRRYEISKVEASSKPSEIGKWSVRDEKDKNFLGHGREKGLFDSEAEAKKALALIEAKRNHRVVADRREGGEAKTYGIARNFGGRKQPIVKGGFPSYQAAEDYMAAHPEEIIEHKFPFPEKPWLDRIDRIGPERRTGNVTPRQFQDAFGFRGGEFGNWNVGSDGQQALNHAYDALHDLADALGIPSKAISLNGELAIAFGARGQGLQGARAHYERDYAVINLTKIKGAGSAAHEWFHALDHYLARQDSKAKSERTPEGTYPASQRREDDYVSHGFSYKSKTRDELRAAFKDVMQKLVTKEATGEIDQNAAQKQNDRMSEHVTQTLAELRKAIEKPSPYGRKQTPATAEQLKQWDALAAKVEAGDVGERTWISTAPNKPAKYAGISGRYSYPVIEQLNDLYKQVTGRSFAKNDQNSTGHTLRYQIDSMMLARKRLSEASQGATETKARPTDYFKESRKIDDYRASDYWSTPHEMGARAFEAFVGDKLAGREQKSDYLVHGADNRYYQALGMKPYPEGEERESIDKAFQHLFDTIKHEETEKGVRLYASPPRALTAEQSKRFNALELISTKRPLLPKEEQERLALLGNEPGEAPTLYASKPNPIRAAYDKLVDTVEAAKDEIKSAGSRDAIVSGHDAAVNIANNRGEQAANSIRLDIPDKADREAMPFVIEAGGDPIALMDAKDKIATSNDPKLAAKYGPVIERAIADFGRLNLLRAGHDKMMAASLEELRANGIELGEVENYATRKLDEPDSVKDMLPNPLFAMSSGAGGSPRYFTRGRAFATLADAIQAGYPPKSTDLADLDGHRIAAAQRILEMNRYIDRLKATPAPTDGKPIIGKMEKRMLAGGRKEFVVPQGYSVVSVGGRSLVIHNQLADTFRNLFGHSAVRASVAGRALLKFAAIGKGYTLVFDTFHVGRILFKMATSGGDLPLTGRNGKLGWNIHRGLSILEYSDDDLARAEAAKMITPAEAAYARKMRPMTEELLKAGLNVGRVADNLQEQAHVHLPIVGGLNDWIFGKLSRGAMLQTALKAYERNLKRPNTSREQAARQTAKEMNELFGNLQNQGLFTSKTMQDISRLILLAPQWTESQARYEGRAYAQGAKAAYRFVRTGGKEHFLGNSARAMAIGFVALLAVNQVLNYLTRGKSTFENPEEGHKLDAWLPGGKRGFWFNPAEIAAENFHAAEKYFAQHQTPVDVAATIASNKISPLARGVKEAVSGRDYAGRTYLTNTDRARAAITDALPSPMPLGTVLEKDPRQPLGYRATRFPGAVEKQLLQSVGAKVSPYQSPRTQMFAIAQPFRADRAQNDAAGEYTELRRALDNNNANAVRSEIQWLQQRGKSMESIRRAVGIQKDGSIKPEMFAGSADREAEMLRALTPEQRKVYDQAQADHRTNALKFLQYSRGMPPAGQRGPSVPTASMSAWQRMKASAA